MDRYFRSRMKVRPTDYELYVSIHLLWTGTLEAAGGMAGKPGTPMFQSIFYGQVL